MINRKVSAHRLQPPIVRLAALTRLDDAALSALADALNRAQTIRSKQEITIEGEAIGEPRILVSGWAARMRLLADGRRQLLSFLLPGDLIGLCHQKAPLAVSTIVSLTTVTLCQAPSPNRSAALREAYAISAATEEARLLAQVARLGRLTAQERIGDLLLELLERMQLAGLADANSFECPLTQEVLADTLGLTSVHVNRMVQQARRDGTIEWRQGRVIIVEPAMLARSVGRSPIRVTQT